MLKVSGMWLSPAELETRLLAQLCGGSRLWWLPHWTPTVWRNPLRTWCSVRALPRPRTSWSSSAATGLPSFGRPRRIVFVDGYPTTATGKGPPRRTAADGCGDPLAGQVRGLALSEILQPAPVGRDEALSPSCTSTCQSCWSRPRCTGVARASSVPSFTPQEVGLVGDSDHDAVVAQPQLGSDARRRFDQRTMNAAVEQTPWLVQRLSYLRCDGD